MPILDELPGVLPRPITWHGIFVLPLVFVSGDQTNSSPFCPDCYCSLTHTHARTRCLTGVPPFDLRTYLFPYTYFFFFTQDVCPVLLPGATLCGTFPHLCAFPSAACLYFVFWFTLPLHTFYALHHYYSLPPRTTITYRTLYAYHRHLYITAHFPYHRFPGGQLSWLISHYHTFAICWWTDIIWIPDHLGIGDSTRIGPLPLLPFILPSYTTVCPISLPLRVVVVVVDGG